MTEETKQQEQNTELKKTWGGARKNAGRKTSGRKQYKTISVSGLPEQIEKLQKKAEESGMTVSRYILFNLL